MADDLDDEEDAPPPSEADDGAEGHAKKKRLLLIVAVATMLLTVAVAGTVMVLVFGGEEAETEVAEGAESSATLVYHEVPPFLADLKTGTCRASYLRLAIVVELPETALPRIKEQETVILDTVQAHLRENERAMLVGKEGTERLRFDLLRIINQTIAPAEANAVLFREFVLH